jgi:membrane protease subunit (stomatin/prohibitin family)
MAIVDVVKYNGTSDVFAWKYPSEELGTWTQLIVNESQEAVLFKGGQAMDVFGPGSHTLDTKNTPILTRIISLPFGGRSPFAAEVWYVNKLHALDIKWGTRSAIQLQDPKYGIFVPVRSHGQFGINITHSNKFLQKLVGSLSSFNKTDILNYFRGLYLTKIKDSISSYLVHRGVSILEINAYLDELSGHMKGKIEATFEEYGINLVNFFVNDISVPEDDPAVFQLKNALAKRAEMNIIGYDYQLERSFNTLEGAAANPGAVPSSLIGAGLGVGMGVGIGGAVGSQFGGLAQNINTGGGSAVKCPNCGITLQSGKKFCPGCGTAMPNNETRKVIKCSNCNAIISPGMKFCPECGNPYNPCPNCGADMTGKAVQCAVCGYIPPKPCPHCGKSLEKSNAKFCPHCGGALVKKCPSCQTEVSERVKFCPECGAKIQTD